MTEKEKARPSTKEGGVKALLITIVVLLLFIISWHLILPLLGISIVLTAAAGSLLIWFVPVLVIAALLFLVLPLLGSILIGILMSVVAIVVIVLFPLLLPIILPVWLLCALVVYLFKR